MSNEIRFEAQIKEARQGGAGVEIPIDVKQYFGKAGLVKVKATFDDYPYRGSLAPMGGGKHFLGILKEIRAQIGKEPGDFVCVTIEPDNEPRKVEIPDDLLVELNKNPKLLAGFNKLSYTHQKEHVKAITEAKRAETRTSRIQKCLQMITDKMK